MGDKHSPKQRKKDEQQHALVSLEEGKEEEVHTSRLGAQIILKQIVPTKLKDLILLDTYSSKTIFCNKSYVQNIRKSDTSLILKTNAGEFRTEQVADIMEWKTVWFNEESESNIFSFAEMAENIISRMITKMMTYSQNY